MGGWLAFDSRRWRLRLLILVWSWNVGYFAAGADLELHGRLDLVAREPKTWFLGGFLFWTICLPDHADKEIPDTLQIRHFPSNLQ